MVLGKLPVPGRGVLQIWIRVGQGPTALASIHSLYLSTQVQGWSGCVMVLGKLTVPGRPTNLN